MDPLGFAHSERFFLLRADRGAETPATKHCSMRNHGATKVRRDTRTRAVALSGTFPIATRRCSAHTGNDFDATSSTLRTAAQVYRNTKWRKNCGDRGVRPEGGQRRECVNVAGLNDPRAPQSRVTFSTITIPWPVSNDQSPRARPRVRCQWAGSASAR